MEYEIIDAHVHLWRSIEHERVAIAVPGRRDGDRWGTPDAALSLMDRCGISQLVFLNVMPTEEMTQAALRKLGAGLAPAALEAAKARIREEMVDRVRRQNQWACDVGARYPRLIPFIGIQKVLGAEGMVEEVNRAHAGGARGVKLQPGMNLFFPNDRDLWPMYARCQELGMPIASDTGTYGPLSQEGVNYGEPVNFAEVLEGFPRLTMVMCHFASAFWDERIEMARRYPNLYFDISGGFAAPHLEARDGPRAIAEEDAVRTIRRVGVERFMFGTDGPFVMPQPWIEQLLRLGLTDEETPTFPPWNQSLPKKLTSISHIYA